MSRILWLGARIRFAMIGAIALTAGCSSGERSPTSTNPPAEFAASVEVSPNLVTLTTVGAVQQLTAVVKNANGSVIAAMPVTWRSSSDAIATVSSSGSVTAVASGWVTISATSGNVTGTASVTVNAPPSALQWTIDRQSLGFVALRKVWQAPTGEVFVVGENGTIARGVGNVWSRIAPSGTNYSYYDVWGVSAQDVVVVSANGLIQRWDGTGWTTQWSDPNVPLYAVWGTASNNIFAVGAQGVVQHWNGTLWQRMDSGLNESLVGVWASSASNAIAVSWFGSALHWNGTAWRKVNTGVGKLRSVWGFSPTDVYAVGGNEAVHWDGQAWSRIDVGVSWNMHRVIGTPDGDLFVAAAEGVLHRRNGAWEPMTFAGQRGPLTGVWPSASTAFVAVGDWGVAYRWDSSGWSVLLDPTTLDNVFSLGPNDTYILGIGLAWRWNGSRMSLMNTNGRGVGSVWGTSTSSLWAAAVPDVVMRWDGTQWHEASFPSNDYPVQVFGTSATNVVALTRFRSLHWDGLTWQQRQMPLGLMPGIPRMWGTAADSVYFAVGPRGAIATQSANQWQATSSGTTVDLHGVWGTSSRNVYAVGKSGVILRWDGSTWQRDSSGTTSDLYDVWGTAIDDIYAVGQNGLILRKDGTGWRSQPSGTTQNLYRIHGASANAVFAVGLNGVVLRGSR